MATLRRYLRYSTAHQSTAKHPNLADGAARSLVVVHLVPVNSWLQLGRAW
jgi:hypothetical protein